jgi:hypothetical protein
VTDAVFYALTTDGVVEQALPGWHLMRARKSGSGILAGQWGLVRVNDPDFVWHDTPTPDPFDGLTDEQINDASEELKEADRDFGNGAVAFGSTLKVDPEVGYDLVVAAEAVGFDREEDGSISFWLFDYLGRWIREHAPISHTDARL